MKVKINQIIAIKVFIRTIELPTYIIILSMIFWWTQTSFNHSTKLEL